MKVAKINVKNTPLLLLWLCQILSIYYIIVINGYKG